jgi:GDP-4-dehydro-6-deoxy-D-mannose reductase
MARALLQRGDELVLAGTGDRPREPRILTEEEWKAVRWVTTDIRSDRAVRALLEAARPDLIVHLAGISSVSEAEEGQRTAYEINVLGAVMVATGAVRLRVAGQADPLLLVAGTGMQYGAHDASEMPLDEHADQRPVNAYAATKAAQEIAALQIGRASGLRVICTRSFNHSGVGHDSRMLLPSLVRRVKALPARGGVVAIGNDVVRDYLHVDDVIRAYVALADQGIPGEVYNIASGVGVGVSALAAEVLARAGVEADVRTDPSLRRASDIMTLIGSPAKLVALTGWKPVKSHTDIIDDLPRADG